LIMSIWSVISNCRFSISRSAAVYSPPIRSPIWRRIGLRRSGARLSLM
jgi:hypothetical protein